MLHARKRGNKKEESVDPFDPEGIDGSFLFRPPSNPNDDDEPVVICFRPDSAADDAPPLRIPRKLVRVTAKGVGSVTRYQFPLIPAHAITVYATRSHLPRISCALAALTPPHPLIPLSTVPAGIVFRARLSMATST